MYKYISLFDGHVIASYNLCLGLGLIFGFLYLDKQISKIGLNHKTEYNLYITLICSFFLGFIGADFFECLYHNQPITIHYLLQGGITFDGGVLTAFIIFSLIAYLFKLNILHSLNLTIPSLVVAHAFGRIGCFLGGCCFGCPTNSILGVTFPVDSLASGKFGYGVSVHPTQLYESFFLFLLFFILIRYVNFNKRLPFYLISYGLFRFFIEYLRGDDRGVLFTSILSPSQIISLLFLLSGSILFVLNIRQHVLK